MSSSKILIVEDDPNVVELITIYAADVGIELDHVDDGEVGLQRALSQDYSLVILDCNLPKIGGLEICRRIREQDKSLPILMLTSRGGEIDRVLGFETGADDYLTKPFSVRELLLRVRALLRRSASRVHPTAAEDCKIISSGSLLIDPVQRKVCLGESVIELSALEFDLLYCLASSPGRAFSRDELLVKVWGYEGDSYELQVNSYISRLRAKLEKDPNSQHFIKTLRGVGYRFASPDEIG